VAWRHDLGAFVRQTLTARVYDVAHESPLELAPRLSEQLNNRVYLKREDLQQVFSFKLRGAFNKMASLSREDLARGVVCSSAGNHAQGVALASQRLGCDALICMPNTTPDIKVANVKRLGANVKLVGDTYDETQAFAMRAAEEEGRTYIAPFDDPYVIAGQGTIGNEILRQISDLEDLHAIFVPVGGGGLLAGVAAFIKQVAPHVLVIGVEPAGSNCMALALAKGHRVTLDSVDGFADGVAVKTVGAETFRVAKEFCDGVVLVNVDEICAAIKDVFNDTRSILEPAGAIGAAGAKAYLRHHGLEGKTVVAVTSGANMNFDRLRLVSDLADVGAREFMMATTIKETPGAFKRFVDALGADDTDGVDVTELKYRYAASPQGDAHILHSVAVSREEDASELVRRLTAGGMPTLDLTTCQEAQVHLRHLVGGRARSFTGSIPHERIFTVDFPERPGALARFLEAVRGGLNITLFHYRKTGNNVSQVLLGIQVPPEKEEQLRNAVEEVDYTFREIDGTAYEAFGMFIY